MNSRRSLCVATCAMRYDNLGSAFGLALKISLVFLAYALLEVFMDGRRRVRSRHDSHRPVDLSNAQ